MLSEENMAMNVDVKGYASKDARQYVIAGLPYSFSNLVYAKSQNI